jgi:hypothetical protein
MIELFYWEIIDPNKSDEELDERYVNSTIAVPEPSLVDDPLLPVPSQTIPATAQMKDGEEPQLVSDIFIGQNSSQNFRGRSCRF